MNSPVMGELRMALEDGRLFITNSRGSGTYTPIAIKDPVILHRAGESALISLRKLPKGATWEEKCLYPYLN